MQLFFFKILLTLIHIAYNLLGFFKELVESILQCRIFQKYHLELLYYHKLSYNNFKIRCSKIYIKNLLFMKWMFSSNFLFLFEILILLDLGKWFSYLIIKRFFCPIMYKYISELYLHLFIDSLLYLILTNWRCLNE